MATAVERREHDLMGQRFGRLVVVGSATSQNGRRWVCMCDCGKARVVRAGHLRSGGTNSCGCLQVESCRNALRIKVQNRELRWIPSHLYPKLKNTYRNMLSRCYEPSNPRWDCYGGRGIAVCDEWLGLSGRRAFYRWALDNGCDSSLQIDRINVHADYSPANCRWVNPRTQANNTRRNRFIEWRGVRLTMSEWADRLGLSYSAMQHRIDRGWPMERIASQPQRGRVNA
jgi:hypothetical protein